MSVRVSMNLHVAADDVAEWASRGASEGRTVTSRMMNFGAENRAARDEVMIRLRDLRGSIEAIRIGVHADGIADTRTHRTAISYGMPASYHGLCFIVRSHA